MRITGEGPGGWTKRILETPGTIVSGKLLGVLDIEDKLLEDHQPSSLIAIQVWLGVEILQNRQA